MEFVEGQSLARLLREQRRIVPTIAADYIHQAALGLQHAHERGVIHRDVKPANLLFAQPSGTSSAPGGAQKPASPAALAGQIKLLDLGLARFLQDQVARPDVTREGTGMGTPDYMAPEQFRDARHADVRSDIYALGCTLYQLLAGSVPFPGSSLSEKWQAHEEQWPPPLEELCPEAPAGLMLVTQRMMAKQPGERFQTAAQVADALAPYIAGSSPFTARLKSTLNWQGGQLTTGQRGRGPLRGVRWPLAVAAAAVVAMIVAVVPTWRQPVDQRLPSNTSPSAGTDEVIGSRGDPSAAEVPKVVTIPGGLTVAKDGTGQLTSISAALNLVTAGMTIRVLDQATYRETLSITNATRHAGLVLEATAGATLAIAKKNDVAVYVKGVPNVTIRGFKFRSEAFPVGCVDVITSAPGLLLENLDMAPGTPEFYDGISFDRLSHSPADAPAIVRNCMIRQSGLGIGIRGRLRGGTESGYASHSPCAGVLVQDNDLYGCEIGISGIGHMSHVHIVGNRIWGGTRFSALQLDDLHPETQDILLANNTVLECVPAFRLWDNTVKGRDVVLRNNLFLGAPEYDMVFYDSGGSRTEEKGPGDVTQVAAKWQMDHNWREVGQPSDKASGRGRGSLLRPRTFAARRSRCCRGFLATAIISGRRRTRRWPPRGPAGTIPVT